MKYESHDWKSASPLVSVVLTTYNQGRFLSECLQSLEAQSFSNFEVILVDDCSDDGTREQLLSNLEGFAPPHLVLFSDVNEGVAVSFDKGARLARGQFIVPFAADDVMYPDRLKSQLSEFLKLPHDVGVLFSDMDVINESGDLLEKVPRPTELFSNDLEAEETFLKLLSRNFVPAPATIIRKVTAEKIGFYDTTLKVEDYDFWLRVVAAGYRLWHLPLIVTKYRCHQASMSQSSTLSTLRLRHEFEVVRKWAGRSRLADEVIYRRALGFCLTAFRQGLTSSVREIFILLVELEATSRVLDKTNDQKSPRVRTLLAVVFGLCRQGVVILWSRGARFMPKSLQKAVR